MWIEIEECVSNNISHANNQQIAALESIALSVFYGRHILYAKRKTLDWLCTQNISSSSKSVCQKIKSKHSELSAIRDNIGTRLVVVFGEKIFKYSEGLWIVSIDWIAKHPVQFGELLAENLSDALIYLLAAEHYKIESGLKGVAVNLNPVGGGGSQIYPSFVSSEKNKNTFCLAITDTDKDYPDANPNQVSQKCQKLASKRTWVVDHVDVPARELENILPFYLLEDAIYSDPSAQELHERMRKVKSRVCNDFQPLLYCDLKLGTKFSWASDKNQIKSKYWKAFIKKRNLEALRCGKECGESCNCHIVEPLCETIAEKFLQYCNSISPQKQYEKVKISDNANEWLTIGKAVFDWGVALPKIRY